MNRRTFLKSVGAFGAAASVGGGYVAGRNAGYGNARAAHAARSNAGLSLGRAKDLGNFRTIYSVETDQPLVALTFDDGPDPRFTPRILDTLADRSITATFFMMGHNVQTHRSVGDEVMSAGHEAANHTWHHLDLSKLDPAQTNVEIRTAHTIISEATGQQLRYFRPPRGAINGAALKTLADLDYDLVMWSITGGISARTTAQQAREFVVDSLTPGAIVGLHDGIGRGTFDPEAPFAIDLAQRRDAEIDSLGDLIDEGQQRGFRFVTVSELLAAQRSSAQLSESPDQPG